MTFKIGEKLVYLSDKEDAGIFRMGADDYYLLRVPATSERRSVDLSPIEFKEPARVIASEPYKGGTAPGLMTQFTNSVFQVSHQDLNEFLNMERGLENPSGQLPYTDLSTSDNTMKFSRKLAMHIEARERRLRFLINLIGEEVISRHLKDFCPYNPERREWVLVINEIATATLSSHSIFLESIDNIYKLIMTILKPTYFISFWIEGKTLEIIPEDELIIMGISKNSPEEVQIGGIAVGLKAVAEVLSIGKQYSDIKTAHIRVQEAKLELKKKELDLIQIEENVKIKSKNQEVEAALELERKHLEVERLKKTLSEEELKLRRLRRQDTEESLELLAKTIQILNAAPQEMKEVFANAIERCLETLYYSPYEVSSFRPLPSKKRASRKAKT